MHDPLLHWHGGPGPQGAPGLQRHPVVPQVSSVGADLAQFIKNSLKRAFIIRLADHGIMFKSAP